MDTGRIDRRTGAAGATYGIGFAIALPQDWNGRFLLQGGGGLNGSVQPPIGFAVASTDAGHEGKGGFDASFQQDQQASLDFAYVPLAASPKSPSVLWRSIMASPLTTPTLPAAPPAVEKPC